MTNFAIKDRKILEAGGTMSARELSEMSASDMGELPFTTIITDSGDKLAVLVPISEYMEYQEHFTTTVLVAIQVEERLLEIIRQFNSARRDIADQEGPRLP